MMLLHLEELKVFRMCYYSILAKQIKYVFKKLNINDKSFCKPVYLPLSYDILHLVAFAYHEHSWYNLFGSGPDCESLFLSWGFGTRSVFSICKHKLENPFDL